MNDEEQGSDVSAPSVLIAVFVIATCGLVYELIAGTLASYVLGDSVTQFSTIIGVYLFAMGVGSWLSRFVEKQLVGRFIEVEIAVALLGGASAAVLFLSFARISFFRIVLYAVVLAIGILVGLEVPLLMRILKDRYDLKDLVARVLTADYLGALLASLAFPLFLVPELGLVRGSFTIGCLNAIVALWCTQLFAKNLGSARRVWLLRMEAAVTLAVLSVGVVFSGRLTSLAEEAMYADPIIFAKTTPYQRIVVTGGRSGFQLFLNGNLQFATADEHRYHEALVHPVLSVVRTASIAGRPVSALILGGGDGLALRELLRYPQVSGVTLVDLDPAMTGLGASFPLFRKQNGNAFADPRVEVVNEDALAWLPDQAGRTWDAIIIDFPDPNNFTLGKLYTTRFYGLVKKVLAKGGAVVVQATSPLLARRSFWCVAKTMEASGFFVRGYHATVPSFGEWGYLLAAEAPFEVPSKLPDFQLRFLTPEAMAAMFVFPLDMGPVDAEVNRLNNQILVRYYEAEWSRWN